MALQQNGMAIAFASSAMQADRELMEMALTSCGQALQLLPHFQDDEDIKLNTVNKHI